MDKFNVIFGNRIRLLRIKAGLSQDELAERTGTHRTYIGSIERGTGNPSLKNIRNLAIALDISLEELFEKIDVDKNRETATIASLCYEIIRNCKPEEQKAILEILNNIIKLKQL